MLPPYSAGTTELRASPPAGATPMQPRNGVIGILIDEKLESSAWNVALGSSAVDVVEPDLSGKILIQHRRVAGRIERTEAGRQRADALVESTVSSEDPTTSVSPGSSAGDRERTGERLSLFTIDIVSPRRIIAALNASNVLVSSVSPALVASRTGGRSHRRI